jgi:hypothetical protein
VRTFSGLTQASTCAHPEVLDFQFAPNPRRTEAAATGEQFHLAAAEWIAAHQKGETFFDSGYAPVVRRWLQRLRGVWTPPEGCEVEVALGLEDVGGEPRHVNVHETSPHVYVPILPGHSLLTAGRADVIYHEHDDRPDTLVCRVGDWKTSRDHLGPPERIVQLLAAGIAACLRGGFVAFVPAIYYVRAASWDVGRPVYLDSPDGDRAWDTVRQAALRGTDSAPGHHCIGCWSSPHRRGRCEHSAVEADA